MRKGLLVLIALLAICITISAASAADWSFNFGSSSSSDGGDIKIDNDKLSLQGIDFKIPEGYKENESARILAKDTNQFGENGKVSATEFYNNNSTIVIKSFFATDGKYENLNADNATEKTIGGQKGFVTEKDGEVLFDYLIDGKICEIVAPNEDTIGSLLKA